MKRCLDTSKEIFCSILIAESLKSGQHFQKSLTFTHDIIRYISLAILLIITSLSIQVRDLCILTLTETDY